MTSRQRSATPSLNAYELLGFHNPDRGRFTCMAWAPSQGRRCRNPINRFNRDKAELLLARLPLSPFHAEDVLDDLHEIASLSTCWLHELQADGIAERWYQKICKELRRRAAAATRESHVEHVDERSHRRERHAGYVLEAVRTQSRSRSAQNSRESSIATTTETTESAARAPVGDRREECGVCLDEYDEEQMIRAGSACRHRLCQTCRGRLVQTDPRCPFCRARIDTDPVTAPATEESTTEEPATEESTTEEPATQEPATQEPTTQEPATEAEPTTEAEPATEEPATEEPTTERPTTEEPVRNNQEECGVCREEYDRTHVVRASPGCPHELCRTCRDRLLETDPRCPFCRANLSTGRPALVSQQEELPQWVLDDVTETTVT